MKTPGLALIAAVITAGGSNLSAQEKITYHDHILPLVETHCSKCHNADKKKGDLDLTSYSGVMAGGGSGKVVVSGDPDGSKLFRAVTHAEDPTMPPNKPKLPDKELDLVKKWITGGLLETATGKAVTTSRPAVNITLKPSAGRPAGPPPLPGELPLEPLIHTARRSAVTGLAASPWAPLAAVAGQKQVLLYHTETDELLGILVFPDGQPEDLKFSRNGKLLVAGGGHAAKSGRVLVWDITSGELLMTVGREFDTVLASDLSADQARIALGGPDRLVKIYSTKSGECEHRLKKHTDWVTAVAFSPDGEQLASADRNGGISIWDPDNGQEIHSLPSHKSGVTALAWRDDSRLLASASEDGTVKLWEAQEGKPVKSWTAHTPGVTSVAFSHDGRLVTSGRDNVVIVWDANGGKLKSFASLGELPTRVAFDAEGKRVVAADWTGQVGVWTAGDERLAGELDANPLPLSAQIAAAEKRIKELQSNSTAAASRPAPNAAVAELAKARADLAAATNSLQKIFTQLEKQTTEAARLKAIVAQKPSLELTNQHAAARNVRNQSRLAYTNMLATVEAARRQVAALQDKVAGAPSADPAAELAAARARLDRLQDAQAASEYFRLRESVAIKRQQLEQLNATGDKKAAARVAQELTTEEKRLEKLKADREKRRPVPGVSLVVPASAGEAQSGSGL